MNRRQRGFTPFAIIAGLVGLALLTAYSLATYTESMQRAHRAEATTALSDAAQATERFFKQHETYAGARIGAGGVVATAPGNGNYTLAFVGIGRALTDVNPYADSYTLVATPDGTQVGDTCGTYTLDRAGNRAAAGATPPPAGCW
jgi:type IV pilus assembly protein PilE